MFRRNLKNNLKDEIMRNKKTFNNIFDLIKVVIDFDDKLYKRAIKKDIINFKKEQEFSLN